MGLFHIQEEAVGSVFWHPKGWKLYRTVEDYMRRRLDAGEYREVRTPQLVDRKLWIESGHWEKFREHMFVATVEDESNDNNDKTVAAKDGNNNVAKKQDGAKYWVSERSVGEFSRAFQFPTNVDQDNVRASLTNGILSVTVPKAKKPEGRRIAIN